MLSPVTGSTRWTDAAKIKALRLERGMTQADLAHAIGFHRTNLVPIEKGQQEPSVPTLARIARALDVSMDDLIHEPAPGPGQVAS